MKKVFCLLCFIFTNQLFAQEVEVTNFYKRHPILIDARNLIQPYLTESIFEGFYTKWIDINQYYLFVYAAYKDSLVKAIPGRFLYFGDDTTKAHIAIDSMKQKGLDVMLYKTPATSAAMLHKQLDVYDDVSLAFLVLHEGGHNIYSSLSIYSDYSYEESFCDAFANLQLQKLFNRTRSVKRFIRINERVFKIINKGIEGKIKHQKAQRKIFRVTRRGTLFQQERYRYPVNNAYLLRYRDYSLHYFNTKTALQENVWLLKDIEQQKLGIKNLLHSK